MDRCMDFEIDKMDVVYYLINYIYKFIIRIFFLFVRDIYNILIVNVEF